MPRGDLAGRRRRAIKLDPAEDGRRRMETGDGWVHCSLGHRHWGRYGAAGILITDGRRVILQHRAPWTHEGGSWGVPGGARDPHESAVQAAEREAFEEAGLQPGLTRPVQSLVVDHGGWSYTTVVALGSSALTPHAANAESVSIEWVFMEQVDQLTLHRGFAAAWPALADIIRDRRDREPYGAPTPPAS